MSDQNNSIIDAMKAKENLVFATPVSFKIGILKEKVCMQLSSTSECLFLNQAQAKELAKKFSKKVK